jgi:PilX N-terminal
MTTKGMAGSSGRRGERGFALVLAILSLMLLTFLGLTLATTTSTELQIATNYRWSQQALYNAEAGLEAARVALANVADLSTKWVGELPARRTGSWLAGAAPAPTDSVYPGGRDFEKASCDTWGGVGYGLVLKDDTGKVLPAGVTRYENISTLGGESLNGAFTLWIRRPLAVDNGGQFSDATADDQLVIVSEGVAPYGGSADAFIRTHQATRVLETRLTLVLASAGEPCGLGRLQGQEGGSPMGENFNPCANLTEGSSGSLAGAFGGSADSGGLAGYHTNR